MYKHVCETNKIFQCAEKHKWCLIRARLKTGWERWDLSLRFWTKLSSFPPKQMLLFFPPLFWVPGCETLDASRKECFYTYPIAVWARNGIRSFPVALIKKACICELQPSAKPCFLIFEFFKSWLFLARTISERTAQTKRSDVSECLYIYIYIYMYIYTYGYVYNFLT